MNYLAGAPGGGEGAGDYGVDEVVKEEEEERVRTDEVLVEEVGGYFIDYGAR